MAHTNTYTPYMNAHTHTQTHTLTSTYPMLTQINLSYQVQVYTIASDARRIQIIDRNSNIYGSVNIYRGIRPKNFVAAVEQLHAGNIVSRKIMSFHSSFIKFAYHCTCNFGFRYYVDTSITNIHCTHRHTVTIKM